jgi:hypothetical protein
MPTFDRIEIANAPREEMQRWAFVEKAGAFPS